jgi:uncharacterized protein DUF4199
MEEQKVMTHIVKGLIVALLLIVLGLVGHFAGIEMQTWFRWLPLVILFAAIIWACTYYSTQLNGYVTFGNVFSHGFKMTAVITVILIVWTVISVTLIFPEVKEKALETARQQMEDKGTLSSAEIDRAIDITSRFFLVFTIGSILFGTLIVGAIASLIGAGVAKKKPVNPLDQMSV